MAVTIDDLPVAAYLFRHPQGNVLFDSGCHPSVADDAEGIFWVVRPYSLEYRGEALPTEAQFEWASGHGDGRKYPWGDTEPSCELADFTPGGSPHLDPAGDVGCHGGGTSEVKAHPKGKTTWPDGEWTSCRLVRAPPLRELIVPDRRNAACLPLLLFGVATGMPLRSNSCRIVPGEATAASSTSGSGLATANVPTATGAMDCIVKGGFAAGFDHGCEAKASTASPAAAIAAMTGPRR